MSETRIRVAQQLQLSPDANSVVITDSSKRFSFFSPPTTSNRLFYWDGSAWSTLGIGTNLSISSGNLNASAGSGGYATIQEEGTNLTQRNTINFVGSGITASDDSSNSRTNVTLDTFLNTLATQGNVDLATSQVTNRLPFANMAQLDGLSVLGRYVNSIGNMAAITASSDNQVLRRSGTSIGFGAVNLGSANAVSGTLPASNGGTGNSSYSVGDILHATASNALSRLAIGANGRFLRVSSGAPSWQTASVSDLSDASNVALLNANNVFSGNNTFNNALTVAAPTSSSHAATKEYVDNLVQGAKGKASVRVATTAALSNVSSISSTQINFSTGPSSIDGINISDGDRILVKNETGANAHGNGIYVRTSANQWTRSSDADTWSELVSAHVWVEEGTTNQDSGWLCTVDAGGTLGTTDVTWVQFSGLGQITAGAGLTKTGNVIDVNTASSSRIVVNADNIDLATTGVSSGTYGSASQVASITVDAYGRLTNASNVSISITSSNITDFTEAAQDAVGAALTDSSEIDFTYNDASNQITASLINGSISLSRLANITGPALLGRSSSGSGAVSTITLGGGLAFVSGSLAHEDTSSVSNLSLNQKETLASITFDTYGHVITISKQAISLALGDLSDVSISSPTNNQVLLYNGTNWVNQSIPTSFSEAFVENFSGSSIDLDANDGTVKDRAGNNIAFTVPSNTANLFIYRNGILLAESGGSTTRDYSVNTSTHVITFTESVTASERLLIKKLA